MPVLRVHPGPRWFQEPCGPQREPQLQLGPHQAGPSLPAEGALPGRTEVPSETADPAGGRGLHLCPTQVRLLDTPSGLLPWRHGFESKLRCDLHKIQHLQISGKKRTFLVLHLRAEYLLTCSTICVWGRMFVPMEPEGQRSASSKQNKNHDVKNKSLFCSLNKEKPGWRMKRRARKERKKEMRSRENELVG